MDDALHDPPVAIAPWCDETDMEEERMYNVFMTDALHGCDETDMMAEERMYNVFMTDALHDPYDERSATGNHPVRLLMRAQTESRKMEKAIRTVAAAIHPIFGVNDFLSDSDRDIDGDSSIENLDRANPLQQLLEENHRQLELLTEVIIEGTNSFEQCIQDAMDYNCEDLEERFGDDNWEEKYNYECNTAVAEVQEHRRVLLKQKKIQEQLRHRGEIRKKLASMVPPMDQLHVVNNIKIWKRQWSNIHIFLRKIYFHIMEGEDLEAFLASRTNVPPQPEKNIVLDSIAFQEGCDAIFVDDYYFLVRFAIELPAGPPTDPALPRRYNLRRPYEVQDIVE